MTFARRLLPLGLAVPVLYFGTLIVASLTWPGYSHVTRYASELGGPEAPLPWVFNGGIITMGAVCLIAAIGFGAGLRQATRRTGLAVAAAIGLALFGVAMMMGGLFPMPDERHGAFGLAFAVVPVPLLAALALRGHPRWSGLAMFLTVSFVLMAGVLAVMMGVGGLVTRANVGLWQRANALSMFPWIGVAAWQLDRGLTRAGGRPR